MKNLDKIITNILILTWVGLSCSILKAEVVITEIFILQANNTHTPQYVELYNNSDSLIDLTNWSITTLDADSNVISESLFDNNGDDTMEIGPFGYFIISSSFCNYSASGCAPCSGCNNGEFYNGESDIIFQKLILPFADPFWQGTLIDKGSVILKDISLT